MTNEEYEQKETILIGKIKHLLSDEFLNTLTESAKTYGWNSDYIEICYFVEWCHEIAGKDKPNMDPYE